MIAAGSSSLTTLPIGATAELTFSPGSAFHALPTAYTQTAFPEYTVQSLAGLQTLTGATQVALPTTPALTFSRPLQATQLASSSELAHQTVPLTALNPAATSVPRQNNTISVLAPVVSNATATVSEVPASTAVAFSGTSPVGSQQWLVGQASYLLKTVTISR